MGDPCGCDNLYLPRNLKKRVRKFSASRLNDGLAVVGDYMAVNLFSSISVVRF